jgi:hypothetical protein
LQGPRENTETECQDNVPEDGAEPMHALGKRECRPPPCMQAGGQAYFQSYRVKTLQETHRFS